MTAARALAAASVAAALAALALAVAAVPAGAQGTTPPTVIRVPATSRGAPPARLIYESDGSSPRARRTVEPLSPALTRSLRRAVELRVAGLPERALDTLRVVQHAAPHHPAVVLEVARNAMAREDWSAATSLLRSERALARDSLLGSAELEQCGERLGHPRDAAKVVVETWVAEPRQGQWALSALLRLLPQDPRGTTDELRSAQSKRPERADLARGLALLLARQGRPEEAARVLADADRPAWRLPVRRTFADEVLFSGLSADTAAAIEALVSLAGDTAFAPVLRVSAASRAFGVARPGERSAVTAQRLVHALDDVPPSSWGADLLLALSRGLRESGRGTDAQRLLSRGGDLLRASPPLALERAWAELREGPPADAVPDLDSLARAWPHARFALAEAEFYAGQFDSSLANHQRVAADPSSPDAVRSLERVYLIEAGPHDPALRALARLAYERWRGDGDRARSLADSVWHALPLTSPFSAYAALQLAELRGESNDWSGALEPLMVVADSLPGDRLAPVARQHAGEAWLELGDPKQALAQFEECLARYPRAWNAAEVRRQVERLRREPRL